MMLVTYYDIMNVTELQVLDREVLYHHSGNNMNYRRTLIEL